MQIFHTIETRWFIKGKIPEEIQIWYDNSGEESLKQAARTDHYLRMLTDESQGVKLREGRIEIKKRTGELGMQSFSAACEGHVDTWCKWSFILAEIHKSGTIFNDQGNLVKVAKERWLKRILANNLVCLWELTGVNVDGHSGQWWTIAFEAFGEQPDLSAEFSEIVKQYSKDIQADYLNKQNSMSYSAWLSTLLNP